MKALLGASACLFVAACGQPPATESAPAPPATPSTPFADVKPLQPELSSEAPYVHELLVGEHSDETDPADLQPVAEKAMACGGYYPPWEYTNEPRALALDRANRSGNELRIGGQTLVDYGPLVVNGVEGSHDSAFYYLGVLKRLDLDVVFEWPAEDTAFRVFDPASATSITMEGLPIASPSGRLLAALADSEMNWVGLEIAERGDVGLKVVKKIETRTYPCGLKWLSDTRATFEELKPVAIKRGVAGQWRDEIRGDYGTASIELRNGEWVYTPAKD